jgi:hypothetical protein
MFGVLTEVLTNQGIKLWKDVQDLCEKALINHLTTSQGHFEADGLAEQMVKTMPLEKQHLRLGLVVTMVGRGI